ncbi:uncharacterized protein EAF02_001959 [Botrytis sinoallii]|uniref:uncharacterized protein n=1 Tax=Botrytis sinoallii TaxID=1463999 RepID=UPI00190102FF|nr:uncharacterized protein EAF02_001959 [Botrytis sinoallii]KAF7889544.1 hypothetical protein EAF02_001959 [Botrytis sinoallii]
MDSSSWGILVAVVADDSIASRKEVSNNYLFLSLGSANSNNRRHHDVAYTQLELNLRFGTSTPRTYNERYYYVQDSTYYERNSANAACITVNLLRLSRSVKKLVAWLARSMRRADMDSALNTLARISKQNNIDRRLQSPPISKRNVLPVAFILTPVRLGAGSDTQVARPGDWALNNTEQHIQETLLGASGNIGMNGRKSLATYTCRLQTLAISYRGHSEDFVTTSTPVYSPGHIGYLPDADQYRWQFLLASVIERVLWTFSEDRSAPLLPFVRHQDQWMMHPSGGDSMYLDMAMEKGDEEAISPTLAYRENEKTKHQQAPSTSIGPILIAEVQNQALTLDFVGALKFCGEFLDDPTHLPANQTPPLDYGLSHPVEPTTIETDPPPDTSPAYIASTSLSSKRRGFRRSWTAPINGFNFTGFVGNTRFEAVPYGRPIEDIGAGACIVNRQECMDWKDKFEGEIEEQILQGFSKIRHVYFPVQEFHDNSQSAKIVQKEHLNASQLSGFLATCCQEKGREISAGASFGRAALVATLSAHQKEHWIFFSKLKSNCWIVQKEHLNASAIARPCFPAPSAMGREILASARQQL